MGGNEPKYLRLKNKGQTVLLMCGTVSASTCRSGSATVMAKPSAKLTPRMSGRFFVRVSAVPILVPMGVMDCSAPSENRPMPTTSITPPMRKLRSRSGFIGAADIRDIYLPTGFSHFKIEGRTLGSAVLLEFLLHYLTRPEYHLPVREEIYLDGMLDLF